MNYSYIARNYGKDLIFINRLRLFKELNINPNKNSRLYSYYMAADLGIIL